MGKLIKKSLNLGNTFVWNDKKNPGKGGLVVKSQEKQTKVAPKTKG